MTHGRRLLSPSFASTLFTVVVAAAAGCGGDNTNPGGADMASGSSLTLKGVPTNCPSSETAADLYTTVVQNTCAVSGCHGASGTSFQITAAADMHTKWVGVKSSLYGSTGVTMPYVTANDVNSSFLMYKLTGSQGKYGASMPEGAGILGSTQLCKFVAWINSGAPSN